MSADSLRLGLKLALLRRSRKLVHIDFPEQDAFVQDEALSVAAICTRRAGKSNALALRFYKTMLKYPGCMCPYIALTRESSKNTMWPVLQEQNDKNGWGATFTESDLTMKLPNGSTLKLFGADMQNFIRRLRGIKTPGAAVDEAQEFGNHIEDLINNILTPATSDYTDGWIALTGTPGAIPRGYFFDVTQNQKYGFSVHRWSLVNNPFMPDPKGFIQKLKAKMGWDDQHPTLLREYMGRWVLDYDSLLIKYNALRDDYQDLPLHKKMTHVMGVDIGFKDADAICILGWTEHSQVVYLIEESIERGQDISSLAQRIESMAKKYDVSKIVMDEGALGKKIAEELRRRKGIPIHPADKARKMENVTFLNDYMRQGKFKAQKNSKFAQDSELVQIDWEASSPDKIVVKKNYHSDIIDAVLYAFKESPAYANQPEVDKPKYHTQEWFDAEEERLEEEALEHFRREEDESSDQEGWGW